MTRTVPVNFDSRFGQTDVFQIFDEARGKLLNSFIWGVWEPIIFDDNPDDRIHTVSEHELGRIDLIASRFYDNPNLWWVIAYKNDIVDPLNDMFIGQKLRVPNANEVFVRLLDNDPRSVTPESEGANG